MLENTKLSVKKAQANWRGLLEYCIYLHENNLHFPAGSMKGIWKEAAPQELYGLYIGGWETAMMAYDFLFTDPKLSLDLILSLISLQDEEGFIPANYDIHTSSKRPCRLMAPPLWVLVIDHYLKVEGVFKELELCYETLVKFTRWMESNRYSGDGGFYCLDMLDHFDESGYDIEMRQFPDEPIEKYSSIDTTSLMYLCYKSLSKWGECLKQNSIEWLEKKQSLKEFIQSELYNEYTGFFHDHWQIKLREKAPLSILGFWPLIVKAATHEQANLIIKEFLLNSEHFYSPHPISSLSQSDSKFSLNGWLGPVRNSHTLLAAIACINYNFQESAKHLLHKSIEATLKQFQHTQVIWEAYHPFGGHPQEIFKFKNDLLEAPIPHYLPHNPLIAMSEIYHSL